MMILYLATTSLKKLIIVIQMKSYALIVAMSLRIVGNSMTLKMNNM